MKQVSYFSRIRALSCVAIVFLHMFYLAASGFETAFFQQTVCMIVRNCLLWAVPCFVMVSGALLLDPARGITIGKVFRKYIRRVLLALVIFTLIYAAFDLVLAGGSIGPAFLRDWLLVFWTNGSWPHVWYLYMLLGLYLMLPLYRMVTERGSGPLLCYTVVIFFLFLSVLPTAAYLSGRTSGFYLMSYTVYPFFFFIGYAVHTGKIRIPTPAAVLMVLAGTACLVAATYYSLSMPSDSLRTFSSSYASAAAVIQSVGLFACFRNRAVKAGEIPASIGSAGFGSHVGTEEEGAWALPEDALALVEEAQRTAAGPVSGTETAGSAEASEAAPARRNGPGAKILASLDGASFGIYLIHMIVLNVFFRVLHWNPFTMGGLGVLALLAAANVLISWAVTALLRLIPGVKKVL